MTKQSNTDLDEEIRVVLWAYTENGRTEQDAIDMLKLVFLATHIPKEELRAAIGEDEYKPVYRPDPSAHEIAVDNEARARDNFRRELRKQFLEEGEK